MLSRSSSGTSSGTEEDKGLVAPFPQAQAQEEEDDDDVANEDEARIDSPLFFFFVSVVVVHVLSAICLPFSGSKRPANHSNCEHKEKR